ncbi:MAG: hypothetical protein LBD59_00010 [Prevotellaceae bacterium]|jgi:hypothetical protein|nr:hypothetical protein [Prevotellaceae bacterium]
MRNNKHLQAIPATVLDQVREKLVEIDGLITPYVVVLTPQERKELPKMGEKSLSFVEKAMEFANQYPDLRPSYLDVPEFEVDFNDARGLLTIQAYVRQIEVKLSDTALAGGSDAYQSALLFYNAVKLAVSSGVPGAKVVCDELKKRFPNHKHSKDPDTDAAEK